MPIYVLFLVFLKKLVFNIAAMCLTWQDDPVGMKWSFKAIFFADFGILRISLEAAEIC